MSLRKSPTLAPAEVVDLFVEAEIAVMEESRCHREAMESRKT
jgi:hypothetical protein